MASVEDTSDNSDSTSAHGSMSMESRGGSKFQFRPSALSQVAEKMWKSTTSASGADDHSTVLPLPKLAPAQNTNSNIFHSTASSQFIFGKNISNRVAHATNAGTNEENSGTSDHSEEKRRDNNGNHAENNVPATTGGFDVLAAASTAKMTSESTHTVYSFATSSKGTTASIATATTATASSSEENAANLAAAAALYEAAKQTGKQPHLLLAPEEVKTGEEDEMNVLQSSVKLFVFDASKKSWTDRGMAIMRINDRIRPTDTHGDEDEFVETRIVVRLQGSLRVIVNTKLWPDMLLERVSHKRLRLSGTLVDANDCGNNDANKPSPVITVYLISGSQSDVDRIERALSDRRDRLINTADECSSGDGGITIVGKKRALQQSPTSPFTKDSNDQDESPANKKRELGGDQEDSN